MDGKSGQLRILNAGLRQLIEAGNICSGIDVKRTGRGDVKQGRTPPRKKPLWSSPKSSLRLHCTTGKTLLHLPKIKRWIGWKITQHCCCLFYTCCSESLAKLEDLRKESQRRSALPYAPAYNALNCTRRLIPASLELFSLQVCSQKTQRVTIMADPVVS